MKVRIATYNLENLFTRPSAMLEDSEAGQQAIEDHALLNGIVQKDSYTAEDKEELLRLDKRYRFSALNPPKNALLQLQQIRGPLFSRQGGSLHVKPNGKHDWTGWFELLRKDVTWLAVCNTGRVIAESSPDILLCVEVENRPSLERFNDQVLGGMYKRAFPHVMVIDGNDARGIDVGIMSRYPINVMRSHVDVAVDGSRVFSRDCPEYVIELPNQERLVLCPNHFKSKRGGNDDDAQALRTLQATTAAQIVRNAEATISQYVVLGGDLNDTPDSAPLKPLFTDGWKDVMQHASYPTDRPGTYNTGTKNNKIDYLIFSSALWPSVSSTGIERRGSYHPNTWAPFDTVKKKADEASDHHLVWADIEIGGAA
jgi:endonuclease/exonuclease/phosphatase family metal-dependent hydrolase